MYQSDLLYETADKIELVHSELPLRGNIMVAHCKHERAALVGGLVRQKIRMTDALFRSDGALGRNGQCFCAGSTVG